MVATRVVVVAASGITLPILSATASVPLSIVLPVPPIILPPADPARPVALAANFGNLLNAPATGTAAVKSPT